MENKRKVQILEDMRFFFRNHQRYEIAAYIRRLIDDLGGTDKTRQVFLSDQIKDLTISSHDEYRFMINTIESWFDVINVNSINDSWTMDQYKNFIQSKQIKRFLKVEELGL